MRTAQADPDVRRYVELGLDKPAPVLVFPAALNPVKLEPRIRLAAVVRGRVLVPLVARLLAVEVGEDVDVPGDRCDLTRVVNCDVVQLPAGC